jgi:FKBP-type peptidyl-prolyl cis-trans isomerase
LFKKGGKGKLLIPSKLAYGRLGSQDGVIRPNQVVIFDIELIDF